MSLTFLLEQEFAEWPYRHVEREVFGTEHPAEIVALMDRFCRSSLGAGIQRYLFYAASIGSVHGVLLEDGRRLVVKVNRAEWVGSEHVGAVQEVQRYLTERGFPVPEPLLGPTPLVHGIAFAETLLDEGEVVDGRAPGVRRSIAASLSELVELLRPMPQLGAQLGSLLGELPDDQLWPLPHDRRFDFEATAGGAEWIDEAAWRARRDRLVGAGRAVVGHCDWRVEHLRYLGGRLTAVYDSDSFTFEPEPWLVGAAAHAFTTDWTADEPPGIPTAAEALAFVEEYSEVRPVPFSRAEHSAAVAALVYAAAYSARCEHSDALTNMGQEAPDLSRGTEEKPGFRTLLRELIASEAAC